MADFDTLLARLDPDRHMAALFAEPDVRARLMTLYAFYHEIAKVPDSVSESVIGEMRLAWAREAVDDLFADPPKVRRHDVYEALADLIKAPGAPSKEDLITLVEARAADLGEGPFPTQQDRIDYVDRTAVALMRCAVRLARPDIDLSGEAGAAVQAAGRLWGFTGLIRAFPTLCQANRPPLTTEEMAAIPLSEIDIQRGQKAELTKLAMRTLFGDAGYAARLLSKTRASLPAEVFPAVGYASLARGYLKSARKIEDPFRSVIERPLLARQWRLSWASLTGRI